MTFIVCVVVAACIATSFIYIVTGKTETEKRLDKEGK